MTENNEGDWIAKRMHPRIAWSFMLRFKPQAKDQRAWNAAVVKNISLGGCYFYSNDPYSAGQILDIEVQFPAVMGAMKFTGEVKRCEARVEGKSSYGIGVQFINMDKAGEEQFLDTLGFFLNKQFKDKG